MAKRSKSLFLEACRNKGYATLTRSQIKEIMEEYDLAQPNWLMNDPANKIKWGLYKVPEDISPQNYVAPVTTEHSPAVDQVETRTFENIVCKIPEVDPLFVPYGNHSDIETILESKDFHPFFVSGPTGCGKTFSIIQACARKNRAVVRVNMTSSTDEDALIGGFRLINGETVFFHGPVVVAMQEGAILLVDEFDLGDPEKSMCLQSVLEGKGYFIKYTGEFIAPQPGFNVVATSNTKGRGSDTGEYIGTQVLNEAYLDRFDNTFEQGYPTKTVEKKILTLAAKKFFDMSSLEQETEQFIGSLLDWAINVRKLYEEGSGSFSSPMSTRRLVQILKTYRRFGDKKKAITLCTNRYDDIQRQALLEFFDKVDGAPELDLTSKMGPAAAEKEEDEDAAW